MQESSDRAGVERRWRRGGYGCEVGGFAVIHRAVIRQTGTPEWPSLFPPERPANGGAALSLFTARSS